uniref:Metastriate one of each protein family n=1 Tax=Rhipicephalus appendiculatus TaxID=34631 RepID=A0A131YMZ1_RHIAP
MAGLARALAVLLTLHWSTAEETPFSVSIGPCPGTPQVDWTESINAYLRKIPNNLTLPDFLEDNRALGMEIGSAHLMGLGDLWAYKPYSAACFHPDTTHIEATAFARVPLVATISWKGCTGGSGEMGIKVSSSQLRIVFKATPTSEDPAHLELSRIYPVTLEDAQMFITGAPGVPTRLVNYSSVIFKHQIEKLWSMILRMDPRFLLAGGRPHA